MATLKLAFRDVAPVPLADTIYDPKEREQNVSDDKIRSVEWRQGSPALENGQDDVGCEAEVRNVRVKHSLEGELGRAATLSRPTPAEPEMDEADGCPDKESTDAGEIHDIPVSLGRTGGHVHHGDGADGVGDKDSPDRHTTAVDPAEDLGRLARLRHVENSPGADIDGRINGRQAGDQDEGVDKVHAPLPASILNSDGHWALQHLCIRAGQALSVGGAGESVEEGAAHVDEDDTIEDLPNSLGNRRPGVSRFSGGYSDRFDAGVEGGAEDEDGSDTPEAVAIEGAWVAPVPEANGVCLSNEAPGGIHNGEHEVRCQTNELEEGEPEFGLTKSSDAKQLESHEDTPEDEEPAPKGHFRYPVCHDAAENVVLIGEDCCPDDDVVPANSNGKWAIDEAFSQRDEGASTRKDGGDFTEGLHYGEGNNADNTEADDEGSRATIVEGATRANEETRSNDAGEGHHGKVPVFEASLDSRIRVNDGGAQLRLQIGVGTHRRPLSARQIGVEVDIEIGLGVGHSICEGEEAWDRIIFFRKSGGRQG